MASITQYDVLFGRTKQAANHPGTLAFRALAQAHAPQYEKNLPQFAKVEIMTDIMKTIKRKGGRFLRFSNGSWREISDSTTRYTIGQTLRDARAIIAPGVFTEDRIARSKKRSAAKIAEMIKSKKQNTEHVTSLEQLEVRPLTLKSLSRDYYFNSLPSLLNEENHTQQVSVASDGQGEMCDANCFQQRFFDIKDASPPSDSGVYLQQDSLSVFNHSCDLIQNLVPDHSFSSAGALDQYMETDYKRVADVVKYLERSIESFDCFDCFDDVLDADPTSVFRD